MEKATFDAAHIKKVKTDLTNTCLFKSRLNIIFVPVHVTKLS